MANCCQRSSLEKAATGDFAANSVQRHKGNPWPCSKLKTCNKIIPGSLLEAEAVSGAVRTAAARGCAAIRPAAPAALVRSNSSFSSFSGTF